MKKLLVLSIMLVQSFCIKAQSVSTMNEMIKFCLTDYFKRDSTYLVGHNFLKRKKDINKYKVICSDGLPRNFDSAMMPGFIFHTLDGNSFCNVVKKLHSFSFSSINTSISLKSDELTIEVWSLGIGYRLFKPWRPWSVLATDNGRTYKYKYNPQDNNWTLVQP